MSRSKLLTMLLIGAAVWPVGAQAIPDPGIEAQAPPQDLRSPDARDAAGVVPRRAPRARPPLRRVPRSRPLRMASSGATRGSARR